MINDGQNPVLIFIHIPKAAGSTLNRLIDRQYKPGQVLVLVGDEQWKAAKRFESLSPAEWLQVRVFRGHMFFGAHEWFPQGGIYATMLRDPIDRMISLHHYWSRVPHATGVRVDELSLQEFCLSELGWELDNCQTRMIAGVSGLPVGQTTQELLERAKENLTKEFAVVGISERFDESLHLMKRAFGWKNVHYVRHNVTHGRPKKNDISTETLQIIANSSSLDMQLYEYGKELFAQQISRQPSDFVRQVKRFQFFNGAYSTLGKHPPSLQEGMVALGQGEIGLARKKFLKAACGNPLVLTNRGVASCLVKGIWRRSD